MIEFVFIILGFGIVDSLHPNTFQRFYYGYLIVAAISEAVMLIGVGTTLYGCLREQD